MMKIRYIFLLFLLAAPVTSCKQKEPDPVPVSSDSAWKIKAFYPSRVEVWSSGKEVEEYTFTFGSNDMLTSLKRKDVLTGNSLLDVSYSYSGDKDMTAACAFYPSTSKKTCNASLDRDEHTLTCASNISNPWTISVKMDSEDRPQLLNVKWDFSSAKYTGNGNLSETYHFSDGDMDKYEVLCVKNCKNSASTTGTSSRGVTYTYTYSDQPDNQNFGMFLLDCQLHVWAPAGLPANKHLITGMTASCGNVTLPQSFTITYKLNSDGDVTSAVRKDYNDNTLVLTREYKLYYD